MSPSIRISLFSTCLSLATLAPALCQAASAPASEHRIEHSQDNRLTAHEQQLVTTPLVSTVEERAIHDVDGCNL